MVRHGSWKFQKSLIFLMAGPKHEFSIYNRRKRKHGRRVQRNRVILFKMLLQRTGRSTQNYARKSHIANYTKTTQNLCFSYMCLLVFVAVFVTSLHSSYIQSIPLKWSQSVNNVSCQQQNYIWLLGSNRYCTTFEEMGASRVLWLLVHVHRESYNKRVCVKFVCILPCQLSCTILVYTHSVHVLGGVSVHVCVNK